MPDSKNCAYRLSMRLYQRPSGHWYIEFSRNDRRSLKTKDEAQAKRLFKKIKQEALAGRLVQLDCSGNTTLGAFADEYLAWAEQTQNIHTYRANKKALDKLIHYAGKSVRLGSLGQRAVDDMTADLLKQGRKPSTINHYIRHAKAVLSKAVDWKMVKHNPLRHVKQIPGGASEPGFMDAAQARDYISKITDPDVRRMAVAYIASGVRRCELLGLVYPRDIDMDGNRIRVERQKKRRKVVQWVPMHPMFKAVLKSMDLRPGCRVFDRWGHPDTVTHKIKESLREAGYGHLHLHSLRHTLGAILAMAGESERTIADMLGHAQTSTASIYTHATQDHLQKALTAINFGMIDLSRGK
ncbi:tyrosine-type recombinase/integrase [Pseudodesulfovibrio pelocollis]|uniref:tyrosine-type recombinase/integrase n=1 Tax=Pseudodesulfovibrio pelocollis TaxID=3051432 RepID=UPI00255AEDA3|nr:site-specific integrase [Pseudodesulfovibrio sp. SB368]